MAYSETLRTYQVTKEQRKKLDYLAALCRREHLDVVSVDDQTRPGKLYYRAFWGKPDRLGKTMVEEGVIWRNGRRNAKRTVLEASQSTL